MRNLFYMITQIKNMITQIKTLKHCVIVLVLLTGIVAWQGVCFAWSVSGTVYERDGTTPKNGVTIKLNDGTADIKSVTTSAGIYTFTDVANGNYVVKAIETPSVKFFSTQQNVIVQDQDVTGIDFYRKNQPLVLNVPESITIEEGEYYKIHIFDHEPDWDRLFTFQCINPPEGVILGESESEALFEWVPNYNQAGTYQITFTAKEVENWGELVSATMTVTVLDNPEGQPLKITSSIANWALPDRGPAPLINVKFGIKNIPSKAIPYVMNYHSHNTIWWRFGNKGSAFWPQPKQSFVDPGIYTAQLKLTDPNQNLLAQAETTIRVDPESAPLRIFYLSPEGDDSWDGTASTYQGGTTGPWKTANFALESLKPGDNLKILDGTYFISKDSRWTSPDADRGPWILANYQYGAPDKWTTIEAADGANPIFDESEATITIKGTYVKIKGLEFRNAPGVAIMPVSSFTLIERCKFSNFYEAIRTSIYLEGLIVRNNEFWMNRETAYMYGSIRGDGLLFENNTHYWTPETKSGIECTWNFKGIYTANAEIRYNKFIGLPGALPPKITIGGQFSIGDRDSTRWNSVFFSIHDNIFYNWGTVFELYESKDVVVHNNTIFSPNNASMKIYFSNHSFYWEHHYSENITLKNNIFHSGSSTNAVLLYIDQNHPMKGFISDNNIWYASGSEVKVYWKGATKTFSQYVTDTGNDSNSIVVDPLFVNPTNNDLHLSENSPAIDAGADFPLAPVDFDNVLRPQGTAVDIGAYEYTGQAPPTLPGDFNGDRVVDIKDLILVAKDYGVKYSISHIILVAKNYGRTL